MSEARLQRIGAGLLLVGTAVLAAQTLVSIAWGMSVMPFILVVSGPQLPAAIWVLLPWGHRHAARYLPPIIAAVYVSLWNIAILAEGNLVPSLPPLVLALLFGLILYEAVAPIVAAVLFARAWRLGRKSQAATRAEGLA